MKYLGGIVLAVAGCLAQPMVTDIIHGTTKMDAALIASLAGNVVTLAAVGFLLIGFDRGKSTP